MEQAGDLKHRTEEQFMKLGPMRHLQKLAFPRRSGTDGEKKAADYIGQVLGEFGLEPALQEFHYSKPTLLSKTLPPLILLTWILLSLANISYWEYNLVISLVVLALPLALILLILNFGGWTNYSAGRKIKKLKKVESEIKDGSLDLEKVITSRNVVAEIGPQDTKDEILFTAHFDSISSKIPMPISTFSMLTGLIGLLLYSAIYLFDMISGDHFIGTNFPIFAVFAAIVVVLFGIVFISRSLRGNKSHGVTDDGTSVGILLELAKFVKDNPVPGVKFIFGFFGSEEASLVGSTYHYMKREIDSSRLRVISVDMIGEKPPLNYIKGLTLIRKARMDPEFNQEIVSIAETLGIQIVGKKFPYPGSDFAPFMLQGGCRTNWLFSGSRWIHSKNDHLGNVDEGMVNDTLKLIVAYLLQRK